MPATAASSLKRRIACGIDPGQTCNWQTPAEPMRVQIVDPPAYSPPYDRELCAALARAGAHVELLTTRFAYGEVPAAEGYQVNEDFYRLAARAGVGGRVQRGLRLATHVADMLRHRRKARAADVVHYQWLSVQQLDQFLLADVSPRVMTAHDVLPREPRAGQVAATRSLLQKMDGVVVHSQAGRRRLIDDVGVGADRIRVIPHGAFDYLTRLDHEDPLPDELERVTRPVILFFGLLRPYKGLDVLLRAFSQLSEAELWVVGMPRMPLEPLHRLAAEAPGSVRFVTRFVADREIPAYFRRADVVCLPYRQGDQSGVLHTALAFGCPVVVTDVGGFAEVAEHGAARLVVRDDPDALGRALSELLGDPASRARLGEAALAAARGHYSWDAIASETLSFYTELLRR